MDVEGAEAMWHFWVEGGDKCQMVKEKKMLLEKVREREREIEREREKRIPRVFIEEWKPNPLRLGENANPSFTYAKKMGIPGFVSGGKHLGVSNCARKK